MMIVRGVNVFPTQIEELICKRAELAPHYLCVLTRDGALDELTVAVEVRADIRLEDHAAHAAARELEHDIKAYIGTTARIELRPPGGVERSLGKAKRVLDKRKL
jgi:phenylacetate-CoA ligase